MFRRALLTPGALAFFLAAAPDRLGLAMTGLGLVWLVHDVTGSYGRAGLVTGAFAVTEAVIGSQVARVIDPYGQTRVVPLLVTTHGLAIAALLALAGLPLLLVTVPWQFVLALVAPGLAIAPILTRSGGWTRPC